MSLNGSPNSNPDKSDLIEVKVDSEHVFSGSLLQVYRDSVRLPDDTETKREWIDHPGASAVVALFEDGTTLMVEQYRYAVQDVMLEVPAGKRDPGESFLESASRELDEETGWRAGAMTHLGEAYPVIGYSNEAIHFFLATDLQPGTAAREDDEFLRIHRISFEDVVTMVQEGAIKDMKTLVAIQKTLLYLETRSNAY